MRKSLILIMAVTIGLAACGKSDHTSGIPAVNQPQAQVQPQVPQGQAPVIVQQSTQESSGIMPALIGGAVGYMLGSNSNNSNNRSNTHVVEREVIREVPSNRGYAVAPKPTPAVVPKPSVPATPAFTAPKAPVVVATPTPAPKPNYSSGFSGYSSTTQSKPSYGSGFSSSSSRSSSSSFSSSRRR